MALEISSRATLIPNPFCPDSSTFLPLTPAPSGLAALTGLGASLAVVPMHARRDERREPRCIKFALSRRHERGPLRSSGVRAAQLSDSRIHRAPRVKFSTQRHSNSYLEPHLEIYSVGCVISSGTTHASNSASVTYPNSNAAALRLEPVLCACLAIFAALS